MLVHLLFLSFFSLTQITKITAHHKTVNAGVSMSQFQTLKNAFAQNSPKVGVT